MMTMLDLQPDFEVSVLYAGAYKTCFILPSLGTYLVGGQVSKKEEQALRT